MSRFVCARGCGGVPLNVHGLIRLIPVAQQQDINSADFRLGDFKVVLNHMEMILRATAIKIIILLGGKTDKKCPQKRFQQWLQDLSQLCKRLLWSPRLIHHCYLWLYQICPEKYWRKECEGSLWRNSIAIFPFVLMRMLCMIFKIRAALAQMTGVRMTNLETN